MKICHKVNFIAIISAILISAGCQRDDICPEATPITPLLHIAFFDTDETDLPKPPVNLRIRSVDFDTIIYSRANVAEIVLPLRTDADVTQYEFTINAPPVPVEGEEVEPLENTNTDNLSFFYSRDEIYINRACSYRVEFNNLDVTIEEDNNTWISRLSVEEENVENETDTHIYIYH